MERAENLLKRLPYLEIVQLREQWFLHFYGDAGNSMSAKLLRLAIGYRAQELDSDTVGSCEKIRNRAAEYKMSDGDLGRGRTHFMKPGSRLLREYKGKTHEVIAIESGRFVYLGQVCDSLSEVARKITGSPRSGAVFFGLTRGRK